MANLNTCIAHANEKMIKNGKPVHTEKWQGMEIKDKPEARMVELLMHSFTADLEGHEDLYYYKDQCQPNLPWADDHFLERVCGEPINPGKEWANWPWAKSADTFREENKKFNHNYMERYWPKAANCGLYADDQEKQDIRKGLTNYGVRWPFGDLNDLLDLLIEQPLTRQAWLPIFFPEDTGIGDGGRKPCTLGYQFIVRDNKLHLYYPLRSCDIYRHFQDDIYLTIRLGIWVLEECRKRNSYFKNVKMGTYTMHSSSLHCFETDLALIKKKYDNQGQSFDFSGMM